MKKVIIALVLAFGLSAAAQEKGTLKQKERVELTSEQKSELRLKELTLKLDLNASQQKEIKKILMDSQRKMDASKAEKKAIRETKTQPTSDEVYSKRSKMLDEKIAMKEAFKGVLTPEQFEKWEKLKERKKDKSKMRHKKRGSEAPSKD